MTIRLYNVLVPFFLGLARVAGFFLPKVRATLAAREGLLPRWEAAGAKLGEPRILFHVSSVGELEQARPVLEEWRRIRAGAFLLSFFSPSVKNVVREFDFVDHADFLPLDTVDGMRAFFDSARPDFLVLNRYDIWPNLVSEARARGIRIALINASTPPLGLFGKFSLGLRGGLFRGVSAWTFVDGWAAGAWDGFVRDGAAALVTGDPRVDRALKRVEPSERGKAAIQRIRDSWNFDPERTVVAGSTWPADEELLFGALASLRADPGFSGAKAVIVPHEFGGGRIPGIAAAAAAHGLRVARFSSLGTKAGDLLESEAEILVVDAMGVLAELYGIGGGAYVGGGFGRSVHSVIEPAAHGLAVAFGPHHDRMPEAKTLALMGGAAVLRSKSAVNELAAWWKASLRGGKNFQKARDAVELFIKMHRGAGERVAQFLDETFAAGGE